MKNENHKKQGYLLLWIALGILGILGVLAILAGGWFVFGKKYMDKHALADRLQVEDETVVLAAAETATSAELEVEEDPLLGLPVEKLKVTLEKGPSCMQANTFETYYAKNVIDGNRGTAWGRESHQGSKGTFVFNLPCQRLDHIDIWNGNYGQMGAWEDNARVREMTISKRNAMGQEVEIGTFSLKNQYDVQTLYFDFDAAETRDIEILTISVNGKYAGELFQDLYLAEIEFFGNK